MRSRHIRASAALDGLRGVEGRQECCGGLPQALHEYQVLRIHLLVGGPLLSVRLVRRLRPEWLLLLLLRASGNGPPSAGAPPPPPLFRCVERRSLRIVVTAGDDDDRPASGTGRRQQPLRRRRSCCVRRPSAHRATEHDAAHADVRPSPASSAACPGLCHPCPGLCRPLRRPCLQAAGCAWRPAAPCL